MPVVPTLKPPRSKAFALYALSFLPGYNDGLAKLLIADLIDAYERTSDSDWHWFEDYMTYCNPRLPHALFAASGLCPKATRCVTIRASRSTFCSK